MTNNKRALASHLFSLPESVEAAHARIAQEQSALSIAQLLIARCSNGSLGPHTPVLAFDQLTARAKWFANTHKNFQAWLGQGGFCPVAAEPGSAQAPADSTDGGRGDMWAM